VTIKELAKNWSSFIETTVLSVWTTPEKVINNLVLYNLFHPLLGI